MREGLEVNAEHGRRERRAVGPVLVAPVEGAVTVSVAVLLVVEPAAFVQMAR